MASDQRDKLGVEVWSLFLRSHAAVVRRLEGELERAQRMPLTWYDVLLELNEAPERRLRMQELGNKVVLSRSRVSRIVDELCRAGLTRREPDPTDKRASYAVITEEGRRALRSAAPVYLRGINEHFTSLLEEDELTIVRDAFQRVLAAQEQLDQMRP